jgi:uncharacterized protein YdhG (YjbR/CyaY superfamily)
MTDTKKPAKSSGKKNDGFSDFERAAMKERAQELRKAAKADAKKADGEKDVLAAIAEMPESDRVMGKRIHEIVTTTAPDLWPRTWYGMPAYTRDGKVVCFFKGAGKYESRYATFGFEDAANLDDGSMWPTSYALTKLTKADEKKIEDMIKKAAS